jgi:hypothetical protein
MGTARTIIGVWFQFWGIVLIIGGLGLLLLGTNLDSDVLGLASVPLSVVPMLDVFDTTLPKFLPPNPDGTCLTAYIINSDGNLCQRIGSDFETPMEIESIGSLNSLFGFGGLVYVGLGVFQLVIGSIIRGK